MRSPKTPTASPEIEALIDALGKVPGLGPRSARRAALALLKRRDQLMAPLAAALTEAAAKVQTCSECGALDTQNPCAICTAPGRDDALMCVVAEVGDVWALERAGAFRGRYHVLGGVLSALDGVRPEDLRIAKLIERASRGLTKEIIIALSATVDGQTTAHYLTERLAPLGVSVTRLAHGVPVGGELELMDDGTLFAAFSSRRPL
ncbi:MAG: recombination protein RecR [Hydrogenophilaceae bacterium]|jgi:recombination protein RecR|nr:recombination protein RecR [Hydrogenophilaceae bacterium]